MTAGASALTTVRAVGSALPADVLAAVVSDAGLAGLRADDYRLELGVTPREAANRAWAVLTSAYAGFRHVLDGLPDTDRAVGLTREKWLAIVLRELGFGPRLPITPAGGLTADDRLFPISHEYSTDAGLVALHLLGWRVELDKRTPGQAGAADRAPHAMVQEYLNRSDTALWGVLSNGRKLRLLRDSSTLIGQSFVEFDLEAMFDGEVFSDFVVLYLVCHATRFDTHHPGEVSSEDATSADCWLERWRTHAAETGTRALQALSPGVKQAIEALGTGLLQHPANDLNRRLANNELKPADLHHALLRLVYRLLFCFVAEDRGLLHTEKADPVAAERYARWFSTARLRRIATRRRGTGHGDLWQALNIVLDGLGREDGRPELGLPGLGGLFDLGPSDVVAGCELANEPLLAAIRHLTVVQPAGGGPKRMVDYRNLGAEELGSVYESLLEFVPRHDPVLRTFSLESVVGNERKTTGAYYTPTSLIDCLLDSALDPLLDDAEKSSDPEAALLALTVCDPACGSGHFLVAAAKRIAARVATVRARREGAEEPTVIDAQAAMHDVVDRCIYGVDLNPLAAELAKVSLWLESVQPGRALSFLDAHIKVGNALLGTTPALLAAGIPDDAFTALDGDDKKWAASLKKRNREETRGQAALFGGGVDVSNARLRGDLAPLEQRPPADLRDVHLAQQRFREFDLSPDLRRARLVADAWCAAFVVNKRPDMPAITQAWLESLQSEPLPFTIGVSQLDGPDVLTSDETALVARTSDTYKFFHWHLEFPQIFQVGGEPADSEGPGWHGGFSCVLGNPPWERIKLQEQEFFAAADPDIAGAPNAAARKKLISELPELNPRLFAEYTGAKRRADGESQFMRLSGRYPLCGRGDINTYAVFAEHDRNIVGPTGRLGVIVPTGIATDSTTQHFFRSVVNEGSLSSLYAFENEEHIFKGVHNALKFCLLVLARRSENRQAAEFAFHLRRAEQLKLTSARYSLSSEELRLLNPETGTCPTFRSRRDAELTLKIYQRFPVLGRTGGANVMSWPVSFMRMFDAANDSHLFISAVEADNAGYHLSGNQYESGTTKLLPLYEAKMLHHFHHRWGDYELQKPGDASGRLPEVPLESLDLPDYSPLPRYWVSEAEVRTRLAGRWERPWLIGWRRIARSVDFRTLIVSPFPLTAATDTLALCFVGTAPGPFVAALSSFVLDYVTRQKVAGTQVDYYVIRQLPIAPATDFEVSCSWERETTVAQWITTRVIELTFTSYDIREFAVALGDSGSPFRWSPARRALLRAELDAAFFHLYGLDRADTEYVLSTFPIANRNDPDLTPRILREYDAMAEAIATGIPYQSRLEPPPGQGPRHPGVVS